MASKKDMRREDLAIGYIEPAKDNKEGAGDFIGSMTTTLPMAAIFTRNKLLGWTSIIFALQNWLSETPAQKASASTPAYMSFLMSLMSVGVAYLPLFMPPPAARAGTGTGTEAPGAVPLQV